MAAQRHLPDNGELPRAERQWRAVTTLGWPLALGTAPLLLALNKYPVCAFLGATGQPCPLCGGTRACAAIVKGDFLAAWQFSPSVMPVLVLAFVHTVQLAYEAWRGRRVGVRWRIGTGLWTGAGVSMLALWGMRLAGWI